MGMIKYFFEFPARHPDPTLMQVLTWFSILIIGGLLALFVAFWIFIHAPWWFIFAIIGGWFSFSCYHYWYYEIAKVDSIEKRYERNTE